MDEQRAIQELRDAVSWYISFFNDVGNTTPEYFDLCYDLNATTYLFHEAKKIYEATTYLDKRAQE